MFLPDQAVCGFKGRTRCVCSGAAEERRGKDVRHEDPEEASHRGHEAAGAHSL